MDFWFLLECEVEDDFLSVGGGPEGDVLVGPAILTNTTTGYPVGKARNWVVKEQVQCVGAPRDASTTANVEVGVT